MAQQHPEAAQQLADRLRTARKSLGLGLAFLTRLGEGLVPDADTVWLTPLPDLLSSLGRAGLRVRWQEECSELHRAVVDSLIDAFETARPEVEEQVGPDELDGLLGGHRLWSEWLASGRVRKFAFVAERA